METISYLNVGGSDYELVDKQARNDIELKADKTALEKVVSGSPAGVYDNLEALQSAEGTDKTRIYLTTDNGNWNYWNGSSWIAGGIYQATKIENGSITQEKTSFFENRGNLYNDSIGKLNNYRLEMYEDTYQLNQVNGYFTTDYIEIKPNTTYASFCHCIAVFNSSKELLSIKQRGKELSSAYLQIETSDTAKYIRFSTQDINKPHTYLIETNTTETNTDNVNANYVINNKKTPVKEIDDTSFKDVIDTGFLNAFKTLGNLVKDNKGQLDNYRLKEDGTFEQNTVYATSNYKRVEAGKTYMTFCYSYSFYDEDKNFISGGEPSAAVIVIAPENAKYIRISYRKVNLGVSTYLVEASLVGKTLDTTYMLTEKAKIDGRSIKNNAIDADKTAFMEKIGNLLPSTETDAVGVQLQTDGSFMINGAYNTTDFIPVKPNVTYNTYAKVVCVYDKDKKYITGATYGEGQGPAFSIAIPENGAYVRFSAQSGFRHIQYLCEEQYGRTTETKYKIAGTNYMEEPKINISGDVLPRYIKVTDTEKVFKNCFFEGLWERRIIDTTDVMYTPMQGQKIYAKVTGANSITLDFLNLTPSNNSLIIAYKIDNNDFVRKSITEFPLKINLSDTLEHYIKIVVAGMSNETQTYTNDVGCAFKNLTVDTGTIEPIKIKGRKFYTYGDSNAIGYIMFGNNVGRDNGAERTWSEVASKTLRAECVVTAVSGIGVKKSIGTYVPFIGSEGSNNYNTNSLIDSLRNGVKNDLDTPDFIIINLGANDDSFLSADFKSAYINIIKRLQIKYAGAEIFIMRPVHGDRTTELKEIASELSLPYIDTSNWKFTYSTDNWHLSEEGAKETGKNVAEFLLSYFGKSYFLI